MAARDFAAHNEEAEKIQAAYRAGRPNRPPVTWSMSSRMILLDHELNTHGWTPKAFFEDPQTMWDVELAFQRWLRFEVKQDAEMGVPKTWSIAPQWFNVYDAGWFGCEIVYPHGDLPDTLPMFREIPEKLYDTTLPHPLQGHLMQRALEFHEFFDDKSRKETFMGRPIGRPWGPTGTDGPFTVACNLRGATEVCLDLIENPKYANDLLTWVTDGIISRMKAWRAFTGVQLPKQGEWTWMADDSIALLSPGQYREFVLPHHRRLQNEFRGEGRLMVHLCGRAIHQFKGLVEELDVKSFETGFPTDLRQARKELGEDIELIGNLNPNLLKRGPESAIRNAVKELADSGVGNGGKFILRDGNNCAPGTPPSHFAAAYDSAREVPWRMA